MQTFLPFTDVDKSAESLDYRRLGKQRVEAYQIIRILERLDAGTPDDPTWSKSMPIAWRNHPVVAMWKGHLNELRYYFNAMSYEWIHRGYQHNMGFYKIEFPLNWPRWVGNRKFHRSHQSNLIRKDANHYGPQFPLDIPDNLPYEWPKA